MNTETIRQQLQELRLKTAAAELEATLASRKRPYLSPPQKAEL